MRVLSAEGFKINPSTLIRRKLPGRSKSELFLLEQNSLNNNMVSLEMWCIGLGTIVGVIMSYAFDDFRFFMMLPLGAIMGLIVSYPLIYLLLLVSHDEKLNLREITEVEVLEDKSYHHRYKKTKISFNDGRILMVMMKKREYHKLLKEVNYR